MKNELPIFMQKKENYGILSDVARCISKNSKLYLVGGALRNAIYYRMFKKELPQRDYDIVFTGKNKTKLINNLKKNTFVIHSKRKKEYVLERPKIPHLKSIKDFVILDIHFEKSENIKNILKEKTNFTINGFALPLKTINNEDWYDSLIKLEDALPDLKNKIILLNKYQIKPHGSELFTCLRFMSLGFKKPDNKQLQTMVSDLNYLEPNRYKRNVKKLFDYVGGEKQARKLIKELGIKYDIFNIKNLEMIKK